MSSDTGFYNGTKLLSMRDINKNIPEIYMVCSNKTAGKTTYFTSMLVNRFKKAGKKFMVLYRYKKELPNSSDKFFKEIRNLFFENDEMTENSVANGDFHELLLNGQPCGYSVALNSADYVKKMSHLFNDTEAILMDEFQSESGMYCPDEITKFITIHKAVARGQGKRVRYVPVYMLSNNVTILNPYFMAMGIAARINTKTKFYRGNGFVLEQHFNEAAAEAQRSSAFDRAFAGNKAVDYGAEGVYLRDDYAFIEKPAGKSKYLCTISIDGAEIGILIFYGLNILYATDKADPTFPCRFVFSPEQHGNGYTMLRKGHPAMQMLYRYFEQGVFRFKNLKAKAAVINAMYHGR